MASLTIYRASAGAGKTFTLAVEYMTLLINNPYDFKRILAVTFTNKATEEMKLRILSQLYALAYLTGAKKNDYLLQIQDKTGLGEGVVRERAKMALTFSSMYFNRRNWSMCCRIMRALRICRNCLFLSVSDSEMNSTNRLSANS